MTESEFATLRNDLVSLRGEVAGLRVVMDRKFAQVEAKLDNKPSVFALYQAVVVMMFGLAGVVASTVVVLNSVGLLNKVAS